jgi:predicted transcriptional regulator
MDQKKLNEMREATIRHLAALGYSFSNIAELLGTSQPAVSQWAKKAGIQSFQKNARRADLSPEALVAIGIAISEQPDINRTGIARLARSLGVTASMSTIERRMKEMGQWPAMKRGRPFRKSSKNIQR